ncbi:hypothetical protein AWW66_03465 [Micromonospora rosaria]|uniref:Uncharacterized protein n=1 Tax=Micromonospora rosaria TaxID=47874 RepID=A0A136PY72_9ACTN|nr:hypothetical protein [Micromonospora rosaria]KXK63385.1 hypothetical protein AWW66_03465 [Micromonospora rosaria]
MTAVLPDAGPCGWCGHGQWVHKRGKVGCKELGCPCGKYEPAKKPPAPVPGEAASQIAEPTCAYPAGEDDGEHDHAMCEDVVAERRELTGMTQESIALDLYETTLPPYPEPAAVDPADVPGTPEHARKIARIDAQLQMDAALERMQAFYDDVLPTIDEAFSWRDQLDAADRMGQTNIGRLNAAEQQLGRIRMSLGADPDTDLVDRVDRLVADMAAERRERQGAEVQRDQAYERIDEQHDALGRIHAALGLTEVDDETDVVGAVERLAEALADTGQALVDEQAAHQRTAGRAEDAERRVEALAGELDSERATVAHLRTELGRATARGQRHKAQLDEAVIAGVTAATRVLWRYDASQCVAEGCGSRYTVPVEHEHPLIPVTVLVVHRPPASAGTPDPATAPAVATPTTEESTTP